MLDIRANLGDDSHKESNDAPRPKPKLEIKSFDEGSNFTTIFSISALVLVIVFGAIVYIMQATKASALKTKQSEFNQLNVELSTSPLKDLDKQILDLQKGLAAYDSAISGKLHFSRMFSEIEKINPKSVKFDAFSLDENNNVKINGEAIDNIGVAKLIRSFEDSKTFSSIKLVSMGVNDQENAFGVKFSITAKVNTQALVVSSGN